MNQVQKDAFLSLGYKPVNISSKHEFIFAQDVYSYYSYDKNNSMDVYQKGLNVIENNCSLPFLIEREIVLEQDYFDGNLESKDIKGVINSSENFLHTLKKFAHFNGDFSKEKHTDIHLSFPKKNVHPDLMGVLEKEGITFLGIMRNGKEHMPGGCSTGEEWVSYTVQFNGNKAMEYAREVYSAFYKLLSENKHLYKQGILKFELVTDIFLTPPHKGMPAVFSN
ncbi:MAG: hypothetical protein HQK84_10145 [Nitrospinae bacterium]|nr:hypothetical protein [Nitrospinota bacterium]